MRENKILEPCGCEEFFTSARLDPKLHITICGAALQGPQIAYDFAPWCIGARFYENSLRKLGCICGRVPCPGAAARAFIRSRLLAPSPQSQRSHSARCLLTRSRSASMLFQ